MGGHGAASSSAARAVATALAKSERKLSPRKLLMQRRAQQVDSQAPVSVVFHCSGVTTKQWRELKNSLSSIHGRALFQPSFKGVQSANGSSQPREQFAAKVASCAGPVCMLYLSEGGPDVKWSKLLPPDSLSQNMVLLYGRDQSNVLNHVDVKKAANLDLISVYRRGIFPAFFHQMGFFSSLDKLKEAKDSQGSGEGGAESAKNGEAAPS